MSEAPHDPTPASPAPVDLIDETAADTVRPAAAAMALVYGAAALVHSWRMPSEVAQVMVPVIGGTAVVALATYLFLARRPLPAHRAHAMCTGLAMLGIAAPLMHLAVHRDLTASVGLMFLIVAAGMLLLWTPGFVAVIGAALVGWTITSWKAMPSDVWAHYALITACTAGLAFLIHGLRLRSLRKLIALRQREADVRDRLRESEARYRLVAEHTRDMIWTMGADGRLTYLSPSVETVLGFPPDCCVGLGFEHFQLTPQSLARGQAIVDRLRSGEMSEATIEVEHRTRWGHTVWCEISASATRDENGQLEAIYAVSRDISERRRTDAKLRRAKEEAEASARARAGFLAVLSHEIRTPMNGVIGMAELLLGSSLTELQREHAETICDSARRLLKLLDDILDFSRAESGRLELEAIDFETAELVENLANRFVEPAHGRNLDFDVHVEDGVPKRLRGDPHRLRQVLDNLVSNGLKFTERGRVEVFVRARTTDPARPELRFEITDTGIGIEDDVRQSIFEPFIQADASTTRRFGGTGLGLAICAHIVEQMGGEIGVESTPGEGSRFWFEVPFEPARSQTSPSVSTMRRANLPDTAARRRVLIADDNAVNRELAVEMLGRLGFDTESVDNGADAVAAVAREHFAAVLMDVRMPEMDGLEAASRIRRTEHDRSTRTPLIGMTAHTGAGERRRCLDAGMDDYLSKPFALSELADALERSIPRSDHSRGSGNPSPVWHTLLRRTDEDRELTRALIATFLDAYPRELEEMGTALRTRAAGDLERVAHSLKGSANTLGLEAIAETAQRLETMGRGQRLEGADVALAALTGELIHVRAQLGELLGSAR